MQDMRIHLEKLRADAAECALIGNLAADVQKRQLFAKLADRLAGMASEVERAMMESVAAGEPQKLRAQSPVMTESGKVEPATTRF